jgi:hypothetical protein
MFSTVLYMHVYDLTLLELTSAMRLPPALLSLHFSTEAILLMGVKFPATGQKLNFSYIHSTMHEVSTTIPRYMRNRMHLPNA